MNKCKVCNGTISDFDICAYCQYQLIKYPPVK